jgi:hypothetical protein
MEYRETKEDLINTLRIWTKFSKRKVHLIACGGTAMTLLGVKESTKDIDFMVPDDKEYKYFIKVLQDIGYANSSSARWEKKNDLFVLDIYPGKRIHTTELLESPLKEGNHIFLQIIGKFYIGILNFYDLISSKLFRASSIDIEDCLMLVKTKGKEIDKDLLIKRYKELASYEIAEKRVLGHLQSFLDRWEKEVK